MKKFFNWLFGASKNSDDVKRFYIAEGLQYHDSEEMHNQHRARISTNNWRSL